MSISRRFKYFLAWEEEMSTDIINIKGTKNGLVIMINPDRDFEELKNTLKSKIESSRGFFKGAKFTFHLGRHNLSAENTKELEEICCQHGLIIDNGIAWPNQAEVPSKRRGSTTLDDSVITETPREKAMSDNVRPIMREASPSIPSVGVTETDKKPCLFVSRSLRSGQKIKYNGSIVVLGDVNPGSEVTASGDIVVLGSLRGVVHAGANGNNEAIIMAYRLNPVQLRISSAISRPPENSKPSEYPETARLRGGQMVIEPYLTYGLK